MNNMNKFWVLLIVFLTATLAMTGLALAEPVALPTTHYMAVNLRLTTVETSATEATVARITGPMGVPIEFRTFDQITCNAGKYQLAMRIIKIDNNQLVASTSPIPVTAPYDGYIHSQPAVWQVLFPAVGWYRYEVVANDKPIAFYYFIVSFNL